MASLDLLLGYQAVPLSMRRLAQHVWQTTRQRAVIAHLTVRALPCRLSSVPQERARRIREAAQRSPQPQRVADAGALHGGRPLCAVPALRTLSAAAEHLAASCKCARIGPVNLGGFKPAPQAPGLHRGGLKPAGLSIRGLSQCAMKESNQTEKCSQQLLLCWPSITTEPAWAQYNILGLKATGPKPFSCKIKRYITVRCW